MGEKKEEQEEKEIRIRDTVEIQLRNRFETVLSMSYYK